MKKNPLGYLFNEESPFEKSQLSFVLEIFNKAGTERHYINIVIRARY